MSDLKAQWWELEIEDAVRPASGELLIELLEIVQQHITVEAVAVDDVEGGGESRPQLINPDQAPQSFNMSSLLERLAKMEQFDWGDFYLCHSLLDVEEIQAQSSATFPELISKSAVTIRAIDNSFFMLYTRSEALVNAIKVAYPGTKIQKGMLSQFTYPG